MVTTVFNSSVGIKVPGLYLYCGSDDVLSIHHLGLEDINQSEVFKLLFNTACIKIIAS